MAHQVIIRLSSDLRWVVLTHPFLCVLKVISCIIRACSIPESLLPCRAHDRRLPVRRHAPD